MNKVCLLLLFIGIGIYANDSKAGCGIGNCDESESREYDFFGHTISYSPDILCNIEHSCSVIKNSISGIARAPVAEIGANFPGARNELLRRANGHRGLNKLERAAVGCHFPTLDLSRVRLFFDVTMLDKFEAFGGTHKIYWVESEAQTFGYDIFVSAKEQNMSLDYWLRLLVHELVHTFQYTQYDESLVKFGKAYMGSLYDAGMTYGNNIFEKHAEEYEKVAYQSCPEATNNAMTAAIKLSNGHYLCVSHHDNNVNHFVMDMEASVSGDACVWEISGYCIKSTEVSGYLGMSSSDPRWISLLTSCTAASSYWGFMECEGECTYPGFLKHLETGKVLNIADIGFAEISDEFGYTYAIEFFTRGSLDSGSGTQQSGFNLAGGSDQAPFSNPICSHNQCENKVVGSVSLHSEDWADLADNDDQDSDGTGDQSDSMEPTAAPLPTWNYPIAAPSYTPNPSVPMQQTPNPSISVSDSGFSSMGIVLGLGAGVAVGAVAFCIHKIWKSSTSQASSPEDSLENQPDITAAASAV